MKRRTLLASSTALLGSLAGCTGSLFGPQVSESFDQSYDVADGTTLTVDNSNGDIEVQTTDGDRLVVSGEKRAGTESGLEKIAVDVSTGDEIAVDVNLGSGSNFSSRSVDLTVEVPDGVAVDSVSSSNGEVTVEDVTGDVAASSSNGDVEVTDVDGYVRCETSNGDVRARGTTGLRGAKTSNGTVDVEVLAMRDDVTCRSANGSVTVRVGPDVAAAFRLSTSNGEAEVLDVEHTVSTTREGRIEGQLQGASDPLLRLVSGNGDVTLRAADD